MATSMGGYLGLAAIEMFTYISIIFICDLPIFFRPKTEEVGSVRKEVLYYRKWQSYFGIP